MGDVINFMEGKAYINRKSFAGHNGSVDKLLEGHKHLSAAKYKDKELKVLDNTKYGVECNINNVKDQKNINLSKAANAFTVSARMGCLEAKKMLKRHFPETYKHLKEQQKEK
jgi:hypothetical protein